MEVLWILAGGGQTALFSRASTELFREWVRETGLDGNDGTHNFYIFCCTTFWGNHCNQVIPVTVNEASAPLSRYFGPLLMSKLRQLFPVWRAPFPVSIFQLQRCLIGLRSGLIDSHFKIVHCFPLSHSWVFLAVCFESLSCWPATETKLSDTSLKSIFTVITLSKSVPVLLSSCFCTNTCKNCLQYLHLTSLGTASNTPGTMCEQHEDRV